MEPLLSTRRRGQVINVFPQLIRPLFFPSGGPIKSPHLPAPPPSHHHAGQLVHGPRGPRCAHSLHGLFKTRHQAGLNRGVGAGCGSQGTDRFGGVDGTNDWGLGRVDLGRCFLRPAHA